MAHTDLIDPPVGPYSSAEDISKWIKELEDMDKTDSVIDAIKEAQQWLEDKN